MLKHIALNISYITDIDDFYKKILGFEYAYSFKIDTDISLKLFNIVTEIEVVVLKKYYIMLELFISKINNNDDFHHFCIELENYESIKKKLKQSDYHFVEIERQSREICFVRDKSNNLIELKLLI